MTSANIYFISLVGIGFKIHVYFHYLKSLDNSSSPIAINELKFTLGTLQCTV